MVTMVALLAGGMLMVSVVEAMSLVSSILVGSLVTGCWEVASAVFCLTLGMW